MSKKKVKLDLQQIAFALIAVSCSESLHRLAWLLNSSLGLYFKESDTITIPLAKKQSADSQSKAEFPAYKDEGTIPETSFVLIKNKSESQLLFKELQNIDFILLVKGIENKAPLREILTKMKKTPNILAAIEIDPDRLSKLQLIQNLL